MRAKDRDHASLGALKQLLLKPEIDRIQNLEDRLNDPMTRAEEIGRSLPEATSFSILKSSKLSRAVQPIIDDAIKASVKKDPKSLADAIFPALGPGIRKAISATIMGMIQSLNLILNQSFSLQGLKWRIEAFRTRKQFAEVVMLHTLVFQVEQIFLIHRETGIVLDHVVAKDAITQDPDLVSGMLTAIQDFVNDSFQTDTPDGLDTLRMGSEQSVWIEKGERALIAAVIRGTPPMDLRVRYRELIEDIHLQSGSALENFNGDPSPFAIFRGQLKEGLQFQEQKGLKKMSFLVWCLLAAVPVLAAVWGFNSYTAHRTFQQYLDGLKNRKGIIILSAQKNKGEYEILGLKDPGVPDPADLTREIQKKGLAVRHHWEPFYSLDPGLVLQRARTLLEPPETVSLSLTEDGILMARGESSHRWITAFKTIAPTIPGVVNSNSEKITDLDHVQMIRLIESLSRIRIAFENNSTRLVPGQEETLENCFTIIQNIGKLQEDLNTQVQILIRGHTDSSGTEKLNQRLSRDRSQKILDYLILKGANQIFLTAAGLGAKIPLKEETSEEDREYNRAVTFKPVYLSHTQDNDHD